MGVATGRDAGVTTQDTTQKIRTPAGNGRVVWASETELRRLVWDPGGPFYFFFNFCFLFGDGTVPSKRAVGILWPN
jgi:hypothetical protein